MGINRLRLNRRHAEYYLEMLKDLNQRFLDGELIESILISLSPVEHQIKIAREWCLNNAESDEQLNNMLNEFDNVILPLRMSTVIPVDIRRLELKLARTSDGMQSALRDELITIYRQSGDNSNAIRHLESKLSSLRIEKAQVIKKRNISITSIITGVYGC